MSLVRGAMRTFKPTQRVSTVCCCGRRWQHITPLAWGAREQRTEGRICSPAGWKKRELLPPWEYPPEAFSFPFGKDEKNTVHLLCRRVPIPLLSLFFPSASWKQRAAGKRSQKVNSKGYGEGDLPLPCTRSKVDRGISHDSNPWGVTSFMRTSLCACP